MPLISKLLLKFISFMILKDTNLPTQEIDYYKRRSKTEIQSMIKTFETYNNIGGIGLLNS